MTPPPLPESRSMWMTLITVHASSDCYLSAPARLIFLQRKRQQKHNRRSYGEDREGVDIREGSRLGDRFPINASQGLAHGAGTIQTRCREVTGQSGSRLGKSSASWRNVRHKRSLMDLPPP